MKPNVTDILAALTELSLEELRDIRARADFLLSTTNDLRELLFYGILAEFTQTQMPFSAFKKRAAYSEFKLGLPGVFSFIDTAFKPKTKIEQIKIMRILVTVIVQYLTGLGIPATLGTVSKQLVNIRALVDQQFPGYQRANLLPMLIKAFAA